MKTIVSWLPLFLCFSLSAAELPQLRTDRVTPTHKLFVESENHTQDADSFKIDSGYSYTLFNKVDLYVGARIENSTSAEESRMIDGLLSGLNYQLSEKISLQSTLRSHNKTDDPDGTTSMSAEFSSRMQLTDNLDMHATLDYQQLRQGVEVGIGFRF